MLLIFILIEMKFTLQTIRFILLLILPCFFTSLANAELLIKIEDKQYDNNTAFVFYHPRDVQLNISSSGKIIIADADQELMFDIINPNSFNKLAATPKLSNDRRSIIFSVKNNYKSHSIILGEKLTAIQFTDNQNSNDDVKNNVKSKDKSTPTPDVGKTLKTSDTLINKAQIRYSSNNDIHKMTFLTSSSNSKMAAFTRGNSLWIAFNHPYQFSFKNNSVLNDFAQLYNRSATILRFKINESYQKYYFDVAKSDGKNWELLISNKANMSNKIPMKIEEMDKSIKILGNFKDTEIINIPDPEIGDIIKLMPMESMNYISNSLSFIDFSILPSIQGLAIATANDDVEIIKDQEFVQVLSAHGISTKLQDITSFSDFDAALELSQKFTLLPLLDPTLDILNFNKLKEQLIANILESSNDDELFNSRFELAKFLFKYEFYDESLGMLDLCSDQTPIQYNQSLQANFLTAVNCTILGSVNRAHKIYSDILEIIAPTTIEEIDLWKKYNNFAAGAQNESMNFLENVRYINLYPDLIYWHFAFAELEIMLSENKLKQVEAIFKRLRYASSYQDHNSVSFYKARYYNKKQQLNLALELLATLSNDIYDPFNRARSTIDLVKLQLDQKIITKQDAIKKLNSIRFTWRGDKLEYDLLMLIANYYNDLDDVINALRTYMYIHNAFSNKISNFYITSEMAKIFNNIFLPGGMIENIDPFKAVALFNEFKYLNPIGNKGDTVILSIVKMLVQLNLLEEAEELLSHQVNYRLEGEQKVIAANKLAMILLLDNKFQEALNILDNTDKDNFKFSEHQKRMILKAKILIAMKQFNQALNYLQNNFTQEAQTLRLEAIFQLKKWNDYISLIEPNVDTLIKSNDNESRQTILRLAISYYMMNQEGNLNRLKNLVNQEDYTLNNLISLLTSSGTKIDYQDLEKSLNIDYMQKLLSDNRSQLINE
ncbi:MAG: hypothetical protein AB8B67_05110 [Rickettsiaceae bacterium]